MRRADSGRVDVAVGAWLSQRARMWDGQCRSQRYIVEALRGQDPDPGYEFELQVATGACLAAWGSAGGRPRFPPRAASGPVATSSPRPCRPAARRRPIPAHPPHPSPPPQRDSPPRPGRPAAPQAASLTGKFRSSGKQSVAHTREIHLISKIYPLTGAGRASDRPSCYGGAGRGRRDGCRGRCLLGDHRHGAAAHRAGSTFVSWI
jgi:hypothetical protein